MIVLLIKVSDRRWYYAGQYPHVDEARERFERVQRNDASIKGLFIDPDQTWDDLLDGEDYSRFVVGSGNIF